MHASCRAFRSTTTAAKPAGAGWEAFDMFAATAVIPDKILLSDKFSLCSKSVASATKEGYL